MMKGKESRFNTSTAMMVILVLGCCAQAIRVYEGTNFPGPAVKMQKAISKKSLLISKRSWTPIEDNLKSLKADRRSDGKLKEVSKRTAVGGVVPVEDLANLYKVKFSEKTYMQYLKYIKEVPRLEEYTFCMWYKPTNLTHDQTLFSYSLNKNERLLRFWINGFDSTLRMAIRGIIVYKVPTNIQEYKWHHICQSWNGVSGEWQVFLDGKRVGSGVLTHYKGTYIPEGGEITLGPELIGLEKGIYDGIDGEVFGFNLVDESVPQDQANFLNSQYRPVVPPFKKLPPIKKTYQEIKAYISTLPSDPISLRKGNERGSFPAEEHNVIKKAKENYSGPPKRRGNQRIRYPPLRKVVVYNRDDRQLTDNDGLIEINKTSTVLPVRMRVVVLDLPENKTEEKANPTVIPQHYDEKYSIHSYRTGKDDRKPSNYEIYEVLEEEEPESGDKQTDKLAIERKARKNFNLFTAREANKVYTLSNSVKDARKPRFHFETRTEQPIQPEKSDKRSFDEKETKAEEVTTTGEEVEEDKKQDSIPVYETEATASRRKRSADGEREVKLFSTDDPLTDSTGFRRLPQIPDSFINIFTKNASKTEIEEKLSQFFPKNVTKEESNIAGQITESPESSTSITHSIIVQPVIIKAPEIDRISTDEQRTSQRVIDPPRGTFAPVYESPIGGKTSQIKQSYHPGVLGETKPINFPMASDQVREFNPNKPFKNVGSSGWYSEGSQKGQPEVSRRTFDISSGTDLVMRSYTACTTDRGSPVQDKKRLVIAWADTPVRIFGGAVVESARNECGNF